MAATARGGGETFDLEMMRHLDPLGAVCTLLTGRPLWGTPPIGLDLPRVEYLRCPHADWLRWDRMRGGWRLRYAEFWWFERRAAAWIRRHADAFDVVQVCELPTLVYALKSAGVRVPVVMRVTAPDVYDPHRALERADAVVASGTSVARLRSGPRPDAHDVPNGVDVARFRADRAESRRRLGLAEDAAVVLYVARFQTVKNHAVLLEAFAEVTKSIPDTILLLAGSGPLQAETRARATALGLGGRVRFLGETPYERMPGVYAAADVKAISSDYESFCFAALEAMASGLPLVVTRTDWVPRLVGDGEGGFVVPVGDARAMADKLLALLRDPDLRSRMGARNAARAKAEHGWTASAKKLLSVYDALTPRPLL